MKNNKPKKITLIDIAHSLIKIAEKKKSNISISVEFEVRAGITRNALFVKVWEKSNNSIKKIFDEFYEEVENAQNGKERLIALISNYKSECNAV